MNKSMPCAVFQGPGRELLITTRPVPVIEKEDDVILRVGGVGICGSDLSMLEGPHKHPALPGVIFGHEFCGRVHEAGSAVTGLKAGQKVAVDQNPGCGHCYWCREGHPNNCIPLFSNPLAPEPGWPNTPGQWWDGGMAEFVKVPAHYCYPISETVPMNHAAIFEPVGVVVNAIGKVAPLVGEYAAVIGGGPVGLFATALLKAAGVSLIVACETKAKRRELLRQSGADVVVDPASEDFVAVLHEKTGGIGAHVVVEAVGSQFPTALNALAFGGRIAQIGIPSAEISFRPFQIYAKEAQIYGSFLMNHSMNETIRILEAGCLPLDTIITHAFPLEEANAAIETAREGLGGKVIITPNEL